MVIHMARWSQIAAQLPGRTDNEVKNFWNSYIKKRLRERGIDPATHQPLAEPAAATAPASTTTVSRRAVFGDVDLIPTTTPIQAPSSFEGPMLDGVTKLPAVDMDWPIPGDGVPSSSLPRPCYLQGGCFDIGALQQQQHCGSIVPAPVVPSASSSSTLTSMAEAEHCNTNITGGSLPWLELGANAVADAGHVDSCYAGALDELRWSEYFDSAFQAAASQQGALQAAGQCVYGGKDDVPVHFDVHGLSNWC